MTDVLPRPTIPEESWLTCKHCRELVYRKRHVRELYVCPECGHHSPMTAQQRIDLLLDPERRTVLRAARVTADPLRFVDTIPYAERLLRARERTGLDEAIVCVHGRIAGHPVVVAVMDFRFLGGSLGTAVGEQIASAAEVALAERVPLVIVTASGGARMQEGALSLMQMVKTSQALAQLDEAGVLTIAVITDPTYGGVAASFANLTDVVLAEPKARFGFAGPRVIEQTIRRTLPPGFQSAEFLLEHGLVDAVVPRAELRATLARLLACAKPSPRRTAAEVAATHWPGPSTEDGAPVLSDPDALTSDEPWLVVKRARDLKRPTTLDYLGHLVDGFTELRGDRISGECPAIVAGLGLFEGRPAVLIGHQKGHLTRELVHRNFGMPTPAGYRKAARLMRLAGKLGLPVVTLIDTPGAYPGPEAEEQGQAVAIAENLRLMARLPVPIVAVVTGEGGSGGALALGVADRVLMLENAVYSVISPEGCAAILWQSPTAAATAAEALRLTAPELLRQGVVDGVVPEPIGGAQADQTGAAEKLRRALSATLAEIDGLSAKELVDRRWRKFRRFGAGDNTTLQEDRHELRPERPAA
jgi:acetyl-CoA carboxylase carboxyl transferase beta subunit/acetyl-CoA carboxylase carboxyl transferase alpha subunit